MGKETKYYEVNLRTKKGNEKLYIQVNENKEIKVHKGSDEKSQTTLSAICPELTPKEYFERIDKFEKVHVGDSEDLESRIGNLE